MLFTAADVVLINKIDLSPHLDFNVAAFINIVSGLNPKVKIFQVSCKTGKGLDGWFAWLQNEMQVLKATVARK
jgi:hydrogenase nickel incorporation protein HypB